MRANRRWQIGSLLPLIMLLLFLSDLVMRFMPVDIFAFRTWEAVWRESDYGLGPFKPNVVAIKRNAYGDLASAGNIASPRDYHDEEFRADKFGYRNSVLAEQLHPGGMVIGDSFIVGSSETQEWTLPEQLTRLGSIRFYNAGRIYTNLNAVHKIASQLEMTSGLVVYELLERTVRLPPPMANLRPSVPASDARNRMGSSGSAAQERSSWLAHPLLKTVERRVLRFAEDPWEFTRWYDSRSPAKIISRRIIKETQNDSLQPNVYRDKVVRGTLKNNDEMLFYPLDFAGVDDLGALPAEWLAYLTAFADRLAEKNLKMIVLLVPNKATVYGPLLKGTSPGNDGQRLLASLQEELRGAGICAVDLTPVFLGKAEEGLAKKDYLYWRDDTHWNSRGIAVAAHQLLPCIETAGGKLSHQSTRRLGVSTVPDIDCKETCARLQNSAAIIGPMKTPQSGLFALGTASHAYLEFDAAAQKGLDLVAAIASLREPRTTMGGVNLVAGFKPELWRQAAPEDAPAAMQGFNQDLIGTDGFVMPATQHDAVLWLSGSSYDVIFDAARAAIAELRGLGSVAEETASWPYQHDRDLTGFIDGSENPTLIEAAQVALIAEGNPGAGGTILLLQKWAHDTAEWEALPVTTQEHVIGRMKADSVEIEDKASDSHVASTDQDRFGKIFRRNMPYGTVTNHGTMFVGFSADQQRLSKMLESMAGLAGGVRDALTRYTRPLTGSYYFIPSTERLSQPIEGASHRLQAPEE
jgi:putative iron-dependent peroxidase